MVQMLVRAKRILHTAALWEKKEERRKNGRRESLIRYGAIGAAVFLLVYGFQTLDVTYDHWILNGYAEMDIVQHYAGWMVFRESAWRWPLGMMDGLGGGAVTFTDSIPWVSIFFKLFRWILPETFQFFGWYVLLCLVLQGIAAGLLLEFVTDHRVIRAGGVVLFCISPVLLERAFRHTALASHWLILFAIYLLLKSRRARRVSWGYMALSVLSIGIHPYFLPMIYVIFAVNMLEMFCRYRKDAARASLVFVGSVAATLAAGFCIGALGTGSLNGGGGFGFYSMNLNALLNPVSTGGFVWSKNLPVLPQILGNYDGFQYLGLGCLLALPAAALPLVRGRWETLRNNAFLLAACVCLTLFALSNVVTCGGTILLEYPLPDFFLKIAEIFRASSRMFYPVYYLLLYLIVWGISGIAWKKEYWLALLLLVQIWDMSPVFDQKYQMLKKERVEAQYVNAPFCTEAWTDIAKNCDSIKMLNNSWDYALAAYGAKNHMAPDISISRATTQDLNAVYKENLLELVQGRADPDAVYLTNDDKLLQILPAVLPENCAAFDCGNYKAVVSDQEIRAEPVAGGTESVMVLAAELTDENWQNGVRNGDSMLLFPYHLLLEVLLQPGKQLVSGELSARIDAVETDAAWIRVTLGECGGDVSGFQYPAPIYVQ